MSSLVSKVIVNGEECNEVRCSEKKYYETPLCLEKKFCIFDIGNFWAYLNCYVFNTSFVNINENDIIKHNEINFSFSNFWNKWYTFSNNLKYMVYFDSDLKLIYILEKEYKNDLIYIEYETFRITDTRYKTIKLETTYKSNIYFKKKLDISKTEFLNKGYYYSMVSDISKNDNKLGIRYDYEEYEGEEWVGKVGEDYFDTTTNLIEELKKGLSDNNFTGNISNDFTLKTERLIFKKEIINLITNEEIYAIIDEYGNISITEKFWDIKKDRPTVKELKEYLHIGINENLYYLVIVKLNSLRGNFIKNYNLNLPNKEKINKSNENFYYFYYNEKLYVIKNTEVINAYLEADYVDEYGGQTYSHLVNFVEYRTSGKFYFSDDDDYYYSAYINEESYMYMYTQLKKLYDINTTTLNLIEKNLYVN